MLKTDSLVHQNLYCVLKILW